MAKHTSDDMEHAKVKRFLKHVILASKRQHEKIKAKKDLEKHIKHVKKLTTSDKKSSDPDKIQKALDKLDDKLQKVLKNEGKLLVHDVKDNLLDKETQLKIMDIEDRLNEIGKYDVKVINSLKKYADELELKLEEISRQKSQESITIQQKIEQMNNNLSMLKQELDIAESSRKQRDQKIAELEEKVKKSVKLNHEELEKIEYQIIDFEDKFDRINKLGVYDKSVIKGIREKLLGLKQDLVKKRSGIDTKQERFLKKAPQKKMSYAGKPDKTFSKRFNTIGSSNIKHDLKLKANPEDEDKKIKKSFTDDMPPFPGPDLKKDNKKGFLSRLFSK